MITLAAHGSAWLAGNASEPLSLELRHSAFRRVARVEFVRAMPYPSTVVAESVDGWLRWLADRGIDRLWLFKEREVPQTYGIHIAHDEACELWSRTGIGPIGQDRSGPQWVRVSGIPITSYEIARPPLDVARDRLRDAIEGARAFAAEYQLTGWRDRFTQALVGSGGPVHQDLLPPSYGSEAQALAACAAHAWVFGGMMSWLDLPAAPSEDPRYDPLSDELYWRIWDAFIASVNSSIAQP